MTADTLGSVTLSDLDEDQRYAQFDRLQQRMPRCGNGCGSTRRASRSWWCRQ